MSYDPVADTDLAAVVTYLEMRSPPVSRSPGLDARPATNRRPRSRSLPRPVPPRRRALAVVLAPHPRRRAARARSSSTPRSSFTRRATETAATSGCWSSTSANRTNASSPSSALFPDLSGKGHGRWLLAEAVSRAWREGIAPRPRPHLLARSSGGALRLSPRRLHALQARGRALPRPAASRDPAEGLRPSGPAPGHAGLSSRRRRAARRSARASRTARPTAAR